MSARGHLVEGALVGYVASRVMDAATTLYYGLQSEGSKHREEEIAPGGALVRTGRLVGILVGKDLDADVAGRVGMAVHRGFGVAYGVAAAALTHRGTSPWAAGAVVGAAAFVVVDEGTAITRATQYPLVSHGRGVVGHGTFGLAAGALLALTRQR